MPPPPRPLAPALPPLPALPLAPAPPPLPALPPLPDPPHPISAAETRTTTLRVMSVDIGRLCPNIPARLEFDRELGLADVV
jgi:hypothetical protein